MNFDTLLIFFIFFILGPVVKGFFEAKKTRREWEHNRQKWRPETGQKTEIKPERFKPAVTQAKTDAEKKFEPANISREFKASRDIQIRPTNIDGASGVSDKVADIRNFTDSDLLKETRTLNSYEALFAKDNLLSGIILKEILDPPKALSTQRYLRKN